MPYRKTECSSTERLREVDQAIRIAADAEPFDVPTQIVSFARRQRNTDCTKLSCSFNGERPSDISHGKSNSAKWCESHCRIHMRRLAA